MNNLIRRYKDIRNRKRLGNVYDGEYAFVGIGGHSLDNLYPVLGYLNVRLKYICCKSPDKIPVIENKYMGVRATADIGDILGDDNIRGVFVSAAPASHFGIAVEILRSGKSLFIEKPPCASLEELCRLIDMEKMYGSPVVVAGLQKRYSPAVSVLRKKLRGCCKATGYSLKYLTGLYPEGDALTDLFIHPLDLVCFLFGPTSIQGIDIIRSKDGGQTFMLILKHPQVTGMLELSTSYTWADGCETITVNTEKGVFVLTQMRNLVFKPRYGSVFGVPVEKIVRCSPSAVTLFSENGFVPTIANNQLYTHGYFNELKTFVDSVEGRRSENMSGLSSLTDTYRLLGDICRADKRGM